MRSKGIVVFTGAHGLTPRPRASGPQPGTVLAAAATIAARRIVRLVSITAGRDRLNPTGVATTPPPHFLGPSRRRHARRRGSARERSTGRPARRRRWRPPADRTAGHDGRPGRGAARRG